MIKPLICVLAMVAISRKSKLVPPTRPDPPKFDGLVIDSSVTEKVNKTLDTSLNYFGAFLAKLEIKAFEDGKQVDRPFFTGENFPCYAMYLYTNDTLSVRLAPVPGRTGGFVIQKYKDSCWALYVFSLHGETTGPYALHRSDAVTRPGLLVPCKFTLTLDRSRYTKGEPVYGFVELRSDNYYIKKDTSMIESWVEAKGFFKAMGLQE